MSPNKHTLIVLFQNSLEFLLMIDVKNIYNKSIFNYFKNTFRRAHRGIVVIFNINLVLFTKKITIKRLSKLKKIEKYL